MTQIQLIFADFFHKFICKNLRLSALSAFYFRVLIPIAVSKEN